MQVQLMGMGKNIGFSSVSVLPNEDKRTNNSFIFSHYYTPKHRTYQYQATGRHRNYLVNEWNNLTKAQNYFAQSPSDYQLLENYEKARSKWEEAKHTMARLAHYEAPTLKGLAQSGYEVFRSMMYTTQGFSKKAKALLSKMPLVGRFFSPVSNNKESKIGSTHKLMVLG